jgi:hypothetical protein
LLCKPCNHALGFLEHQMTPAWQAYIARHA